MIGDSEETCGYSTTNNGFSKYWQKQKVPFSAILSRNFMTNTPIVTAPTIESPPATILQRISMPLFAFSFVLFASLLASQIFLLPRLTTFTVGNVEVSVDEALAYERQLRAEVISLEDSREEFVLPYIDDAHDALMKQKRGTPSVVELRLRLENAMRSAATDAGAAATIDAIQFDAELHAVTVRGSVDAEAPSTMAALSAAVDAVRALPDVADLTPPALTREQLPDGTYRSPFKFTFTLQ